MSVTTRLIICLGGNVMEVTFLGTGAGIPSKERNVSAIALTLLQDLNSVWLFDCGESTQHQILSTSIKPRKINKVFITHLHGDHIFGLPGLLSSRSFQGGDEDLTIYGPKGIRRYIETCLEVSHTKLTYNLHIIEFTEGVLFDNDFFTVTCKQLDHRIPSYGFRIVEKDKPGELLVEKLKQLGVHPGPIYQTIKSNKTTTLDDGTILDCNEFIGPKKPGRIICILGDTRHTEQNKQFVEHADLLVHEATFSHEKQYLARKYYHSTTVEAALLAKNSQVKKLILTHISSRYQGEDERELRNEAIAIFPETMVAKDFFQFEI